MEVEDAESLGLGEPVGGVADLENAAADASPALTATPELVQDKLARIEAGLEAKREERLAREVDLDLPPVRSTIVEFAESAVGRREIKSRD